MADYLSIQNGSIVYVSINLDVFVSIQNEPFEEDIRAAIDRNLLIFFNLQNWEYGKPLRALDVLKALSNIQQPYKYDIRFVVDQSVQHSATEVLVNFNEIIRQDIISVNFIYE
jgi:hypothetical protein